jgi:hypothetical protein
MLCTAWAICGIAYRDVISPPFPRVDILDCALAISTSLCSISIMSHQPAMPSTVAPATEVDTVAQQGTSRTRIAVDSV